MCTYTLSFTHLMKVGPSSDYNYLSIAWVAQVCCQLSLSGPVPAYVEEYLDDDEYDDNSVEGHSRRGRGKWKVTDKTMDCGTCGAPLE